MNLDVSKEGGTLPPYKDKNLPVEERVEDLLKRMTIEEKVRQLDQYIGVSFLDKTHQHQSNVAGDDAKINWEKVEKEIGELGVGCIHDLYGSVEINNQLQRYAVEKTRLGIPILFSEEALHGYCKPGSTIFPQQIALASTWDPEIVYQVGRAIATEARSYGVHEVFAPVIDLARDPRWGRVEETYGEDTYLSSKMAVAMVKGMQGESIANNDSVIAEPKHFAAYGVPVGGLNCAPALIGERELQTYYLPVFEAAVVEGGAINIMASYNSIDGIPCIADKRLLTDILRDKWGLRGIVRSDLGAILRLYDAHRTAKTKEEAIRQALEAGVDIQYYDFDHEFYQNSIIDMVKKGIISEEVVDRAVRRVLRIKFMLGLFENPYADPNRPKEVVHCKKHQDIALQAAREGICLLKNDNNLLPLNKNIASIAVIGPSANTPRLGDYTPHIENIEPITLLEGIRRIVSPNTKVGYVKGVDITPSDMSPIPAHWLRSENGEVGLKGEYFDNPNMQGAPVLIRIDREINFNWMITKPSDKLSSYAFSVRWTGKLIPDKDIEGYIGIKSYDSMRVWLDGQLIIDSWGDKKGLNQHIPFRFIKGKEHDVKIEYCRDFNGVKIMFGWSYGEAEIEKAVELAKQSDVVIVALGDSTETCGEGLDRADLNLPGKQRELLKAVYETGKPIVLVLQNGRPISLEWEVEHIPAIIEAWYGGEKAGQAIAEVIFGDYNPAGRLPISFPRSVGQVPVYYNRPPGGSRRYVEFDWEPLFPFGHGLSYTQFKYENLKLSSSKIKKGEELLVSIDVTNIGEKEGDEVVQLYLHDHWASVVRPRMELRGFKRIHLKPGETQTVTFVLTPKDLQVLNNEFKWVVEPGLFTVMIGASSKDIRATATFEVVED